MVQDGLEILLRNLDPEIKVTKVSCLDEARCTLNEQLDLILCDVMLPDRTVEEGLRTLRVLHRKLPTTPIIVITALRDKECVSHALEAGARAYIPKNFASDLILSAIRLVMSGGVYVPPELFQPMNNRTAQRLPANASPTSSRPSLTRRQRDVLTLLSRGHSNREIAHELGVTEGTVKIHVAAIFKALGVTNRTQAVIIANRLGMTTDSGAAPETGA